MSIEIKSSTIHGLVSKVLSDIRSRVESGHSPLSSEAAFRFLFAWELGRHLNYSQNYRFDFEWSAFSALDSDDRFLDLLVYTDPKFKMAVEFKLPKASEQFRTNSTQTRAKICRDISRLSYLVRNQVNSIKVGYFLCATDENSYLAVGRKKINPQYQTYHGKIYRPGTVIPKGNPPNGILRNLPFPQHEVRFEWDNVETGGKKHIRHTGRFAWLSPIRIWG